MTKLIPAGVGNSIAARCFAPITIEWLKNIWPPPCLNRIGTISYCMMTEGIFGIGMGSVILGREYSSAKTAISHFLLDVHCLGVKDAHYSELTHEQLREMLDEYESHVDIAPECAS